TACLSVATRSTLWKLAKADAIYRGAERGDPSAVRLLRLTSPSPSRDRGAREDAGDYRAQRIRRLKPRRFLQALATDDRFTLCGRPVLRQEGTLAARSA